MCRIFSNVNRLLFALIFLLAACAPLSKGVQAAESDKPNIVLVFMDNFGWGEPGFNGGGITRGAPTPRHDWRANRRC